MNKINSTIKKKNYSSTKILKTKRISLIKTSRYEIKILYKNVAKGNTKEAKEILKKLLNYEIVSLPGVSKLRVFKDSIIVLCHNLSITAIDGGIDENYAFSLRNHYITLVEEYCNFDDISIIAYTMLDEFIASIKNTNTKKISFLVDSALKYIQENLSEELNLDTVSKYLYVHPKYFSKLFKKDMGVTFHSYVTEVRMEESKRLLKCSNYSILDIAFFVGYNSQSHFTSTFKKYTGCTPKEYKENVAKTL